MIPESGTRSELLAAMEDAHLFPVVGEVFVLRRNPSVTKDTRWRVSQVNPAMEIVGVDILSQFSEDTYIRFGSDTIEFSDWQNCIQDGYLTYVDYDP